MLCIGSLQAFSIDEIALNNYTVDKLKEYCTFALDKPGFEGDYGILRRDNSMRLLIADRDSTERTGIEWLINSYSLRFTEIRQTADMVSLIKELEEYKPNVILVELEMIQPASWDVFVRSVEKNAGAIIAVTTEAVFERAWQAIRLQASGLLIKPLSPDRIRETLKMTSRRAKRS